MKFPNQTEIGIFELHQQGRLKLYETICRLYLIGGDKSMKQTKFPKQSREKMFVP